MKAPTKKSTLLYFTPVKAPFVDKDVAILDGSYDVKLLTQQWSSFRQIATSAIAQLYALLRHHKRTSTIIVMFAGYWSFLPALWGKLFGVPTFIILGGTDCVSFPFLEYGSLRKPLISRFIKWSCQLATRLLPVHESLIYQDYSYHAAAEYPQQGLKAFYPDISTPVTTIYNGFDARFFEETPHREKQPRSFITVALIDSDKRLILKGVDLVITVAHAFPDCRFTLIGFTPEMQRKTPVPANVEVLPFLTKEVFLSRLQQSEYFIQPSVSEGFPNAFGEAMLCGCIPIGSSVGAVPDIIGQTGLVLKTNDATAAVSSISSLLALPDQHRSQLAAAARQRIVDNFLIQRRANDLLAVLRDHH